MEYVILGLGSNRSWNNLDSLELLSKACDKLSELLYDITVSSVYMTKPMYVTDQSDFYNMVLCGYADESVSPFMLLDKIHLIEASLGRDRSKEIRNGPRSIDIDIEFFGSMCINTADLQIPHPRFEERGFVLLPLLDVLKNDHAMIRKQDVERMLLKLDVSDIKMCHKPLIK